ncbi:MAG: hypothetical protein ACKVHE_03870 [Planctomycetales bacterium]|jgi:hypothetical protein
MNDVYQCGATAIVCAALSQTIKLSAGTKRLFMPDAKLARAVDKMAAAAAKDYDGKTKKSMGKLEMPKESSPEKSEEEVFGERTAA